MSVDWQGSGGDDEHDWEYHRLDDVGGCVLKMAVAGIALVIWIALFVFLWFQIRVR